MYLIFDTETTGLPKKWAAPISDTDNWPRAIQIAFSDGTYSITIQLPAVTFEIWEDVSGENSIVRQRIAFVANNSDVTNGLVKVVVVDNVSSHA
jgi:hypothetical protein